MNFFVKHAFRVVVLAAMFFSASAVSAQTTSKADAAFNKAEYANALQLYKKNLNNEKLSVSAQSAICHKIAKC